METTIMGYIGYILYGVMVDYYWDHGKENGNYYRIPFRHLNDQTSHAFPRYSGCGYVCKLERAHDGPC